jgi:hypothetical protein
MSKMMAQVFAGVALAAGLLITPAQSREEIPAETRLFGFDAQIEGCGAPGVLGLIQSRFNANERRYWGGSVEIVGFERVREAGFRPNGLDLIPRRYCQSTAILSNRQRTIVRYQIGDNIGFAGHWDGVHFCVAGYDRNRQSGLNCSRFDR